MHGDMAHRQRRYRFRRNLRPQPQRRGTHRRGARRPVGSVPSRPQGCRSSCLPVVVLAGLIRCPDGAAGPGREAHPPAPRGTRRPRGSADCHGQERAHARRSALGVGGHASPTRACCAWGEADVLGGPRPRRTAHVPGREAPRREIRAGTGGLGPSGVSGHIIRSTGKDSPGGYALLALDGTPVGSVEPFAGTKWGAYEFRDDRGVIWARSACRMPEWVLRLGPATSPPFSRLALAFIIGQRRRHR